MPIEFRLHRFDAHLRQHTIQVEKTLLAVLGFPSEAKQLVRIVCAALADVEGILIGAETMADTDQVSVEDRITGWTAEVSAVLAG